MSSTTSPVPLTLVTNIVNFVGCGQGDNEPCPPWRLILLPGTPEDNILKLITITSTRQGFLNPTLCRTIAVVPETDDEGTKSSESSTPGIDVVRVGMADFNILRIQASLGETVISSSGHEDQLSIEAMLSKIHCDEEWEAVQKRLLYIDESTIGVSEVFAVISRILEALPTEESERKLPAPDLVKAVAGAIGDVVESLNTHQERNIVAREQAVPTQQIVAAPLESAVGVTAQA
ncbi:hypothetical protein DFP72DRAFT_1173080 [Ephemerocybe angulata]|uniref:Uncharacterized protein n=1 Tax=Ephemerocybe angulata TaxID=980116 RepID=A0A8H6HNG2_9AGAR|nr:hypothetical protein DFP72DRAFT_1173080 [Tulosesus angulatus]